MADFLNDYKTVHKAVNVVDKDAYTYYRLNSKKRDSKKFKDHREYRQTIRKIWKKIAEASIEYESGVYCKNFFYFVPQVIAEKPFIKLKNGKIKSNAHVDNRMYTPIFCNLMRGIEYYCWSPDGLFAESYKKTLFDKIEAEVPDYYFILSTIMKNNL